MDYRDCEKETCRETTDHDQETLMNGNNLKPTSASEKPAMGRGDWRTQLRSDLRERIIVNKMFDTLKRHLRSSWEDKLNELRKTVEAFEEKTYNAASNQFNYVRRISLKLLQKETQSQNIVQNSGQCSNNLHNPGSQSMQSEQVHGEGLSHQNIPNDMKGKVNIYDLPGKDGPDVIFPKQWPPLPALYISEQTPTIRSTSVDCADLTMAQQNNHSNMHQQQQQQQQLMAQQNNLSNMHQQQLGPQSNISGLQQQQQQLVGTQSGNSSMQTNQQSLHMLSQPKVALQQTQQTAPNLLPTQGQTSQQPQQQQQLMSQMQSQPTQLRQQLGLQQQPNQVQQNMQQRLQASGQTSSSLLQSQNLIDQQQQLYQSQRAVPETSSNSTAQTGHSNGGDWQEEVYQKIKAMKETYFPELNMMHEKISATLLQVEHDSLPQQTKSAWLEKMKLFKTMLERILSFLTISRAAIVPAFKDKLSSYEDQIGKFIIANRPRKLVSALQQGQLLPTHMHSMQQPQPESNQTQSHDNQMNPLFPSMMRPAQMPQLKKQMPRLQQLQLLQMLQQRGMHRVDELQSPAKIKTNELSYLHQIDIDSGVLQENLPSNQLPGYEQASSEYHAPDTAGIGVPPIMSIPPLLPGFKEVNDTSGNALTTDFGKPDIAEQPHDLKVNMAKPKSLSATVVTMVDEAVTSVGEDLAAMRKQGLHARNFFTQTGMSGAEKMRCYLSALVILALLIFFIFNLNHQY
ncbi:hypothetical protein ES288_D05G130600v1 [Gossypium darwinii]|uniref:Mediator complex subunit 15 KIX domain-containing protein n=1 Tax=Gossypium darwinii TaxID=34276 RepID=A0A5D2CF13_GOSDA|nr:hypothetical protein ES288_D05G130600v1 [Gossypium darwinii]